MRLQVTAAVQPQHLAAAAPEPRRSAWRHVATSINSPVGVIMDSETQLEHFAQRFAALCGNVIQPALEDVMRRSSPGSVHIVGGFKEDSGGTEPTPNNFSILNRHVTLTLPYFAALSFVAWNPDVKIVWRREGEADKDIGLYHVDCISPQSVGSIVAEFLASLRT